MDESPKPVRRKENMHATMDEIIDTRLAHWNKDWSPGNYPKTEEERLAAAKKYNLLPEEYAPVPDDGHGSGDYPGFKPYSADSRDPFYPWDYPEYRRNFNEAMHEDMNLYGEDRYDVCREIPGGRTYPRMFLTLLSVIVVWLAILYSLEDTCFFPRLPQHMPAAGVKHYKYE